MAQPVRCGAALEQAGAVCARPAAVSVNGSRVNIAAVGVRDRLRFYWAASGTSVWHAEQVAPPGSVA